MGDAVIVCESGRLSIRHFTPGDAEFLFQQVNQPSWIQNIGDRGVRNLDDAGKYIEARILSQYRTLGYGMNLLELKSGGEPIGVCGLVKRETLPDPDLGFALLEGFWGHGYALEAAQAVMKHAREVLGVGRVLAIATPSNERSARLLAKLGFQLDGTVRLAPDAETLKLYSVGRHDEKTETRRQS